MTEKGTLEDPVSSLTFNRYIIYNIVEQAMVDERLKFILDLSN